MLYRWHKGHRGNKEQYQAHLELVLKKEQDPKSIPFHVICRYTAHNGWPITTEEVVEEERIRYQNMSDFVKTLGADWYLFTYESMVDKNFDSLNNYLGFHVEEDAEVPKSTGKAKVVRKKPAYLPYMEVIGYDCNEWTLSNNPVIEPEYSSMYIKRLARMKTINTMRRFKDSLLQLFSKKS
jgi:hypothetical protein